MEPPRRRMRRQRFIRPDPLIEEDVKFDNDDIVEAELPQKRTASFTFRNDFNEFEDSGEEDKEFFDRHNRENSRQQSNVGFRNRGADTSQNTQQGTASFQNRGTATPSTAWADLEQNRARFERGALQARLNRSSEEIKDKRVVGRPSHVQKFQETHFDSNTALLDTFANTPKFQINRSTNQPFASVFQVDRKKKQQELQNIFLASQIGSNADVDTGLSWSLDTLAKARNTGLKPYQLETLKYVQHKDVRPHANLLQAKDITGSKDPVTGELPDRHESLESILARGIDTSEVASIINNPSFKPLFKWISEWQTNPLNSPFHHPLASCVMLQTLGENLAMHNQLGKVISCLSAMSAQGNLPPETKSNLDGIVRNLYNCLFLAESQHNILHLTKMASVDYHKQPDLMKEIQKKLLWRTKQWPLREKQQLFHSSMYSNLLSDPTDFKARAEAAKLAFNQKRKPAPILPLKRTSEQTRPPKRPRNNTVLQGGVIDANAPQRCFECGSPDHKRRQCPNLICELCQQRGHNQYECTLYDPSINT